MQLLSNALIKNIIRNFKKLESKTNYIYNYIGIRPGDVYKEIQVKRISSRLKELPFVKEIKHSQILFLEKETKTLVKSTF